jgi:hypothetical protein
VLFLQCVTGQPYPRVGGHETIKPVTIALKNSGQRRSEVTSTARDQVGQLSEYATRLHQRVGEATLSCGAGRRMVASAVVGGHGPTACAGRYGSHSPVGTRV